MNKPPAPLLATLAFFLFLLSLASCEKPEEDGLTLLPAGDYFPTVIGMQWDYRERFKCFQPDAQSVCEWPMPYVVKVEKDTLVAGLLYRKMHDYTESYKLVRKEGAKYYSRNLFYYYRTKERVGGELVFEHYPMLSEEVLFLDTSKPVHYSWTEFFKTSWGDDVKATFTVKAIEAERTIAEQCYKDIIEIEEQVYFAAYQRAVINTHVYAKGVGRVYSFYPYPPRYMTDVQLSLSHFHQ